MDEIKMGEWQTPESVLARLNFERVSLLREGKTEGMVSRDLLSDAAACIHGLNGVLRDILKSG